MKWECVAPGQWRAGNYLARKNGGRNQWELRLGDQEIQGGLDTLEDAKKFAQRHADSLKPINIENYPLSGVTRVEVIDHRVGAPFRGRAFTAHEVGRAELSFQDDNRTLKVFLT